VTQPNRPEGPSDKKDEKTPRKRLVTRRRALIAGGTVVAAGALAAGGYLTYGWQRRFGREADLTIPDHRVPLSATAPRMVVARGADPAVNVRSALQRMEGMGQFLSRDDVVVIKPNIGWDRTPAHAANTHPEVVAEVARACLEVKPRRVIVCDCPVSESRRSFELSGILEAATAVGAEVITPEASTFRTVAISPRLGTWDVLEPFVTATKIINVPIAKHHTLTGVVAGMKNWIGITTKMRIMFHNDIQRSIAELAALMRSTLTVLDATRVLMARGPSGGNLEDVKALNTVAVGTDPVALDAWAFGLFDTKPDELPEYLGLAEGMGLGSADFRSLGPVELTTG
jgi:uncharacterized protein (DUF362 family)